MRNFYITLDNFIQIMNTDNASRYIVEISGEATKQGYVTDLKKSVYYLSKFRVKEFSIINRDLIFIFVERIAH